MSGLWLSNDNIQPLITVAVSPHWDRGLLERGNDDDKDPSRAWNARRKLSGFAYIMFLEEPGDRG